VKTFTRSGLEFRVRELGPETGEVVVLLHGFPANAAAWTPVANDLAAAGYRVLAPDQRGYSPDAQPKKRHDYALAELVGDVLALIEAAGAKRVHLVGHDWGGTIAWAVASWHPGRVASLTVVSTPHPKALIQSLWRSRQLWLSWYMLWFQLPFFPEWFLGKNRGAALIENLTRTGLNQDSAKQYAAFMLRGRTFTSALNWYRAIPFRSANSRPVGAITSRTLFIYGAQDKFLSHAAARLTGAWVTAPYEFKYLPDATHWIPEESPEMLSRAIKTFIYS